MARLKLIAPAGAQVFDDLDSLMGSWSKSEAAQFDAAVAQFAEIDADLRNVARTTRQLDHR
ncbi:MAG: hypothetical protein EXR27_01960 [Betaproteobacteria bacterium]|nr:hypothetical protein [Betaproteobacteria bacterium]